MVDFEPIAEMLKTLHEATNPDQAVLVVRSESEAEKETGRIQSSYKIASQFYTTRLRRFSTLANLLLLEGLGDLLEGPNLVQSPFIGVPPATGGRRITTIISRKETFILPKDIFRPPGWQLHIARPIWPFGPGKRLLSPSNVRQELNSDEKGNSDTIKIDVQNPP